MRMAEMRCPPLPNLFRTLRILSVNARPSWMLGAANRRTVCFITFSCWLSYSLSLCRAGKGAVTPPALA
jgi:hypothetical protein